VDITTNLIPSKLEFDAGKVIAKLAPVVPVKYVFTLEIVADVNAFVVTIEGMELSAKTD
jgi:hypothetical protein